VLGDGPLGVVVDRREAWYFGGPVIEALEQAVALDPEERPLHRRRPDGALRLELVDIALQELAKVDLLGRLRRRITGLRWHRPTPLFHVVSPREWPQSNGPIGACRHRGRLAPKAMQIAGRDGRDRLKAGSTAVDFCPEVNLD
jgi:hypothetical protein